MLRWPPPHSPHTHTHTHTVYQDTFSYQGGLGVQTTELPCEQRVPTGPWCLDRRCLSLLDNTHLEEEKAEIKYKIMKILWFSTMWRQATCPIRLFTLCPCDTSRLTWTNKRCVGMLHVMKLWSRWQNIFSSFAAICPDTQKHKTIVTNALKWLFY